MSGSKYILQAKDMGVSEKYTLPPDAKYQRSIVQKSCLLEAASQKASQACRVATQTGNMHDLWRSLL